MAFNSDTPGMSYALSELGVKGNPDLPVVDASRVAGGGWSVATSTYRDMIPVALRKADVTTCYVQADNVTYILRGGIENSKWQPVYTNGVNGRDAAMLLKLVADQSATVGAAYSLTVPLDLFGPGFTIAHVSGLPAGLNITLPNTLSGTPTAAGAFVVIIDFQNQATGGYVQYLLFVLVNQPATTTPTSMPAATVGAANIDLVYNPIADDAGSPNAVPHYDYDLYLQVTDPDLAEYGQRATPGSADSRYIGGKSINNAIALAALGYSAGNTTQQRFYRFAVSLAVLRTQYPNKATVGFAVYGKRKGANPTDTANNKISAVTINRTKTSGIIPKAAQNNVDFTTNGDALTPITTSTGWPVGNTESLLFTVTVNLSTGELTIGTPPPPATNQPPVVSSHAGNTSGTVGMPFSYPLPTGEFSDSDGTIVSRQVTALPPGLSYNAGTNTVSGTPTQAGTYTVTITAFDNQGASVSDTFTITLANQQPNQSPTVTNHVANQSATVGTAYSQTLPANEFSDSDGSIANITVSGLPDGLSFNLASKQINGTPTTAGTFTVSVTATDNQGATVTDSFTITVAGTTNTYSSNGADYYA